MNVHVVLLVEVRTNTQLRGTAAHHGQRRGNRLLHHLAQLAGTDDVALARQRCRFDGQQLATNFGPRKTCHLTDTVLLFSDAVFETLHPQILVEVLRRDRHLAGLTVFLQRLLGHHLAADLGNLAVETAHPGLAGVVTHDVTDRRLLDHQLAFGNAVGLHLLVDQILDGDADLLVLGVAGKTDDLHAVQQRRWNVQRVGGRHEHHVGQVKVDLGVMIDESVILLRIQHFQQCRRRIATEVGAHLVHFIQQEQRVLHAGLAHVLQHLARHRADIGTTVTTNLGLVTHAAQRHAHELAVGGAGNRLPQRGLAYTGRPDQAQDRRLELVDTLLHREVFQDALLDLFQAKVVFVEDGFGGIDFLTDLGLLLPRQIKQGFDVVAHHGGFGGHRRHHLELFQLGHHLVLGLLGHAGQLDFLLKLVDLAGFVVLAQLFLDRLDLLVQVVLALALFHLALDAAADALLHLQDVDLTFHQPQQVLDADLDVEHLQDFLLLLQLQRQVRDDGVGQAAGTVDAIQRGQDLARDLLVQFDELLELGQQRTAQRFHFGGVGAVQSNRRDVGSEILVGIAMHLIDLGTLPALDQHLDRAVGQLEHLQNGRHGADGMQILGRRLVLGGRALGYQQDLLAIIHRLFQRTDGLGTPDKQGNDHVGEDNDIAQRQQWQRGFISEFGGLGHIT